MARSFPKPSTSDRRVASPNFSIRGEALLRKKFKLLSSYGRDLVREVLQTAAEHIRDRAEPKTPKDSGVLRGSIHKETLAEGLTVRIGSSVPYALFAEAGSRSKPGKLPITGGKGHWQVNPDLAAWAARHGINPWALIRSWGRKETRFYAPRGAKQKARAFGGKIARIKHQGIKGKHFLFPAMVGERRPYLEALKQAIQQDAVELTVKEAGVGAE